MKHHNLQLICRAHQVVDNGYKFFNGNKLVTIFSAPNYWGEVGNNGAIMYIDDDLECSFTVLKPVKKPLKRYNSMSTLPNGEKKYSFNKNDRLHGKVILILGVVLLISVIILPIIEIEEAKAELDYNTESLIKIFEKEFELLCRFKMPTLLWNEKDLGLNLKEVQQYIL